MTKEIQLKLIEEVDKKTINILKSKGEDYANEDVLSNFKRMSNAAKMLNIDVYNPTGYALFMVLLKIDRISNLMASNKEPNNESLLDSFEDGINYMKLAYLCEKEKQS